MFNKNNFCHIASNNRNEKKAGVFVYKTTDDLATVATSGYFNDKIVDINLHDLIIHEWHDPTDRTKVQKNVLCVTERTLDNVGTVVIKSKWQEDIEEDIEDLDDKIDALRTYVDNTFVRKDGTSIMTGPLKFRAGSFEGAIAGGLGDGIAIYKMNPDGTINSEIASITSTNGFVPGTTNTLNMGTSALKWKDAYIARVITAVLNNGGNIAIPNDTGTMALTKDIKNGTLTITQGGQTKGTFTANQDTNTTIDIDAVNTDLSNLSSIGKNISNWSTNVTNCITEIPQDIKLELNAGTLTLKAGSKVYVPNGSGVFDEVTIASDKSVTPSVFSTSSGRFVILSPNQNFDTVDVIADYIYSGATEPTTFDASGKAYWYDTTNNVIKRTGDSGSTWVSGYSFPVAIVNITNGVGVSKINQVFNGFGYVGSAVFSLPGVKGLVPYYRNTDGTLKNTLAVATTVQVYDVSSPVNNYVYQLTYNGGIAPFYTHISYNETDNVNLYSNGTRAAWGIIGYCSFSSGKISDFVVKQPFHAVDYNDYNNLVNDVNTKDAQNVKLTGNQTISGTKTFNSSPIAPTPATTENDGKVATTKWVKDLFSGGFGGPDYSSMITVTSPYTPTKNGYLIAQRTGTYGSVSVENDTYTKTLGRISCSDSGSITQVVMVVVNKGEQYSFSPSNATAVFVPAKGE